VTNAITKLNDSYDLYLNTIRPVTSMYSKVPEWILSFPPELSTIFT
jgi:hypothetical protein